MSIDRLCGIGIAIASFYLIFDVLFLALISSKPQINHDKRNIIRKLIDTLCIIAVFPFLFIFIIIFGVFSIIVDIIEKTMNEKK